MEKIGNIINKMVVNDELKYREPFKKVDDQLTAKIVNKLFLTFQSIFPAFKQAWPTDVEFEQAKLEWVKAFSQVGLHDLDAIKCGVEKFRVMPNPFVPSPGQFIDMCRLHDDQSIPSIHEAWLEVKSKLSDPERIWSHVAIQHAYKQTGSWDLKHLSEKDAKSLFARNYEITKRMLKEGKELEPIMIAIPKQYHATKRTDEARLDAIKKMRELLK